MIFKRFRDFLKSRKSPTRLSRKESRAVKELPAIHKDDYPEKQTTSDGEKAALRKHFVNWTHDNNPKAFQQIHTALQHEDENVRIKDGMKHFGDAISTYRDHNPPSWHFMEIMHIMGHVFKHKGMPPYEN